MRALRIYRASAMAMGLLAILSSCKSTGVGEGASDSGDVESLPVSLRKNHQG